MVVGFTNGCFDLLHPGHEHFLTECRRHCDYLVVGVNSDESVRRLKGEGRPIQSLRTRKSALRTWADEVWSFWEDTPEQLIRRVKPHVILKGGDYSVKDVVGRDVAPVIIIPRVGDLSTSQILERYELPA